MIETLIVYLLLVLFGPASTENTPYADRCAEDEIPVGQVCVHVEGDGWRVLP